MLDGKVHIPSHCYDEGYTVYYRQFAKCADGSFVSGTGPTAETAIADAWRLVNERNQYLAKPDRERLAILLQDDDLCPSDMNEAIHILGRLLLEEPAP